MFNDPNFWFPIQTSIQVTVTASILSFFAALFTARKMQQTKIRGKLIIDTFLMLPLVLPPSVVGFGLLVLFGRNSVIGKTIELIFQQPLVFTWWAAVLAAVVVSFPLIYMTIKTGFESVDSDLEDAARSMGGNERQVFIYVTIPLAWRSLLTGYVLGFARAIGEFGATLMFAGNIPEKTQTLPTAIYIAVESGRMELAYYWVFSIIFFSFILLAFVYRVKEKEEA
ncbi:molybdate ABC transporter permease subunit [Bacillus taeanensis]|uniref:molybdate ABC transporter permease subunit n=1 Tax=Bacillus taeanensis TaxID=273032 RepID=UPI001FE7738B|nr:molybdate ABC transporter permease subunit [Bacillus taeanensis]